MAVTIEGGAPVVATANGGATSITQSITVGSGANRLLLVMTSVESSTNLISSMTFGGVALARRGDAFQGASFSGCSLWTLIAPATSTANVVANLSPSGGSFGLAIYTLDGVDQNNPVNYVGASFGSVTAARLDMEAGKMRTGDLIVDVMSIDGTGHTPAPAESSQTADYAVTALGGAGTNEMRGSHNDTYASVSWSWTTAGPACGIAALVRAAGRAETYAKRFPHPPVRL